jgi:hypothetical protein
MLTNVEWAYKNPKPIKLDSELSSFIIAYQSCISVRGINFASVSTIFLSDFLTVMTV